MQPMQRGGVEVDGLENVVLVLAGVLLGVSAIALGGAYLSSLLFDDASFRAGIGAAALALLRMPGHLEDPAAAWGDEITGLPGATAYWAATAAVAALVAGSAVTAIALFRRHGRTRHAAGVELHPGLAARRHYGRLAINRPTGDRITLGRAGSSLLAAEPQMSLLVIGPSGYGKSTSFAVPNLLEWNGPVLCTSVKGDIVATTIRARSERGTAWVFDPARMTDEPLSTWSPLTGCEEWSEALRMSSWLTDASSTKDGVTDADYWFTQGRSALGPHLMAAAIAGASIRDVHRWIVSQEQDVIRDTLRNHAGLTDEIDEAMAAADPDREELRPSVEAEVTDAIRQVLRTRTDSLARLSDLPVPQWPADMQAQLADRIEDELDRRIRPAVEASLLELGVEADRPGLAALLVAEGLWAKEERLRSSVYSTVENILAVYADPVIGAATDGADIDLDEWLSGPNTLFVVATADEQSRIRPMLTVLVQAAVRRAYQRANENRGTLEHPCLLLLDEAGNIAPLPDLPTYASTARSHGISLCTVWQDLAQLNAIYGDRAATVLNNHRAKVVLGGITDPDTLEWVSRLGGEVERKEQSWSSDGSGRRSMSEHTVRERAISEDVVRRLPENEALLLYGSLPIVHLRLRPWWAERSLRRLGVDSRSERSEPEGRRRRPVQRPPGSPSSEAA